jgi:hypothetical protein
MEKFFIKHKRKLLRMTICIFILSIIAASLYIWCWYVPQKTEFELTCEVEKIEEDSGALKNLQVNIKGRRYNYLLRDDKYEIALEPFDDYTDIHSRNTVYFANNHRGWASFEAYNTTEECVATIYLHFTDEMDRLVVQVRGETYYAGSVSGKYTSGECISYYRGLCENEDYLVSYPVNLTINTVKMNSDGQELGMVPMHLNGYYQEYLFKKDEIFLEFNDFEDYIQIRTPQGGRLYWEEGENGAKYGRIIICAGEFPGYGARAFGLIFTEEFDRFYLISDEGAYYVGSVSGKYTAQEIVAYFNTFMITGITLPEA